MKASFPSLAGSRAGLCDFVPAEDRLFSFGVRHNPQVQRLAAALRKAGIESLLDPARFLALTVLIRHAAKSSPADFIELGVYKGGSAALTALVLRATELVRPLHLCDTFAGMPKTLDWEFHKEFDFADTSLESVSTRLAKLDSGFPFHFHRGLFSQTLPALADRRFCFAHVDADLYESVLQACQFVYPRMAKGGFILFDDYGASTCPGAKRAVDEFFADKLENPTHVASCAYGIRIGQETTDFHRLVSLQGFPSALVNAAYTAPRRALERAIFSISNRLASPRLAKLTRRGYTRASPQTNATSVKDARNILVLRPDTIGDLILTSPFLRELRRCNPGAWITLIVGPHVANLVELCPYVNEVPTFASRHYPSTGRLAWHGQAFRLARAKLWPRHFDLALSPRWDADYYHSAFVSYFSRAAHRIAYSENVFPLKQRINQHFDLLLTRTVDDRAPKHEVERNLDFLRAVGGVHENDRLELWLSEEDRGVAREALAAFGVSSHDLLVGLAPGAGHPKRIWPLGRFITLGRFLHSEFGARLAIVGGSEDRDRAARLQEELGPMAINFAGPMTLRQTAALLERAQLVLANDSGPMHLAAAAGAAVVEVSYHPLGGDQLHTNSPPRFRP